MGQKYYALTRALTISDFKLRYHDSILGVFWSFLKPLCLFSVLYTVFSIFMRFPIPHYGLYLLLGIIFWNFFVEATTLSLRSISQKAPLIRKIYFPRSILVVSATLIALMNFMVSLTVFGLLFIFTDTAFSWSIFLLPIWVVECYALALGFSFGLAAINTKFKDVEHIWEVLLPLGFWITPIIYSVAMVPESYRWLFLLNPMAIIIQNARDAMLTQSVPALGTSLLLTVSIAIILGIGYFLFYTYSPSFAEEL